jgi:hypothetical protein
MCNKVNGFAAGIFVNAPQPTCVWSAASGPDSGTSEERRVPDNRIESWVLTLEHLGKLQVPMEWSDPVFFDLQ